MIVVLVGVTAIVVYKPIMQQVKPLCYSNFQLLKGTQKDKYSINTLYDETIGLCGDLYHLGNLNRRPRASRLRRLYTGFRGDINLYINLRFIVYSIIRTVGCSPIAILLCINEPLK